MMLDIVIARINVCPVGRTVDIHITNGQGEGYGESQNKLDAEMACHRCHYYLMSAVPCRTYADTKGTELGRCFPRNADQTGHGQGRKGYAPSWEADDGS